jgi:hypothetical protein
MKKQKMKQNIEELINTYEHELTIMDGYNDCIMGITERFGCEPHVAYDLKKVLKKLISQGMTEEEAREWFDFNMVGAYVGISTPCFVRTP